MLMLRSHGLGWGEVGWGEVGWGLSRSFDYVPLTFRKMLMLRSLGVGWGGMLTFLRPRSLVLSQDVDATLTWGGVGWAGDVITFLRPRSLDLAQDVDATPTFGCGGVGWGDDNALSTLR